MPFASSDRRHSAERRVVLDRRSGAHRRNGERRQTLTLVAVERRSGVEQRQGAERREGERRSGSERRGQETLGEHIRNALQLLANVAASGALDDEHRRDLDAAMFRLRFALDRLERGTS